MAKRRFHQVVFCSEAEGRAFLREILITPAMGQILANERLPPFYEIPLEQLREQEELILHLSPSFHIAGDTSCPYCGNASEFYCSCGYISCVPHANIKAHVCPKCQHIFTKFQSCGARVSSSGYIHGKNTIKPSPRPPTIQKKKDDSLLGTFKKIQDFVDRVLPDDTPPKNKALPSPQKKALPPPKKKE